MRADQLLVERGLAASRSQAQRLIAAGVQWFDGAAWKPVAKNGDELPAGAQLQLLDDAESRYVSRGGLKLEGALRAARFDLRGWTCLDVGQSTGGFTDCLLQHGAARVTGVDVGHGQLHEKLRHDPRVTAIEKLNARELNAQQVGGDFDLVTGDLSFISLTLVLPALAPLLRAGVPSATQPTVGGRAQDGGPSATQPTVGGRAQDGGPSAAQPAVGGQSQDGVPSAALPAAGGHLLMLAKPQFELQPGQVGKGGVVRDAGLYPQVERRLREACAALGLVVVGWYDSPIAGGDGNREFFLHARRS